MWFAFGLITLLSFTVYLGLKRHGAKWKGTQAVHKSIAYEYLFELEKTEFWFFYEKEEVPRFRVAVKAPTEYEFSFNRESRMDRICKQLGLSVEHQVGTSEFDKLVYIVSNDGHLAQHMAAHRVATDAVIRLFRLSRYDAKVSKIHCQNGRLWAEFTVGRQFKDASNIKRLEEVVSHAAGLLQEVACQLEQHRPQSEARSRDPFIWRAALLLACSSGLFLNGILHFFRLFLNTDEFTVDTSLLWQFSGFGATAIVLALVILALVALGRSARTHLVLIELVLVGGIGATLTLFNELRDLNMEADRSAVVRLKSDVLSKSSTSSRRGGSRYTIDVRDWKNPGEIRTIKVSRNFYLKVERGNVLDIHERAGYLGVPWVEYYGVSRKGI